MNGLPSVWPLLGSSLSAGLFDVARFIPLRQDLFEVPALPRRVSPARWQSAFAESSIASIPAFHRNLLLPEVYVKKWSETDASIYNPLFDVVWNAAGRVSAPGQI